MGTHNESTLNESTLNESTLNNSTYKKLPPINIFNSALVEITKYIISVLIRAAINILNLGRYYGLENIYINFYIYFYCRTWR